MISRDGRKLYQKQYYSQFGEDVILQNLMSNYTGQYLDIGSGHPVRGSNTFGLYQKGWSGITIDPISANIELARKCRPRDTSIMALCGFTNEETPFWEYEPYELSTMMQDRVNELGRQGINPIRSYFLTTKSLSSLGVRATPLDPFILSIDVEGAEMDVLNGNNWDQFTPPIIVIEEHTPPWTKVSEVNQILRAKGYELSDYVGLSSIYIHARSPFRIQRSI